MSDYGIEHRFMLAQVVCSIVEEATRTFEVTCQDSHRSVHLPSSRLLVSVGRTADEGAFLWVDTMLQPSWLGHGLLSYITNALLTAQNNVRSDMELLLQRTSSSRKLPL